MSRKISIDIGKWQGSVTIADPLTIPQAKLIEAGLKTPPDVVKLRSDLMKAEKEYGVDSEEYKKLPRSYYVSLDDELAIPAIVACVEKYELTNFSSSVTADTFPASPRKDSHKLIKFIFDEIVKVYSGEIEIPNG